jgi:Protein of unknown function (DUF2905)
LNLIARSAFATLVRAAPSPVIPSEVEGSRGVTFKVTSARYPDFARHDSVADQNYRMPELGKFLVILGAVIIVLGLLLWSGIGSGWLGRLPGDIRIERDNSAFYFPIVTCIIISIVLSLIFSLFRR